MVQKKNQNSVKNLSYEEFIEIQQQMNRREQKRQEKQKQRELRRNEDQKQIVKQFKQIINQLKQINKSNKIKQNQTKINISYQGKQKFDNKYLSINSTNRILLDQQKLNNNIYYYKNHRSPIFFHYKNQTQSNTKLLKQKQKDCKKQKSSTYLSLTLLKK